MERREREELRRRYQPKSVSLLFIGESPPASGRFFYRRDSGLYRAMRDAFRVADPEIDDDNFLGVFQASGCYLIDLCPEPVDGLDPAARKAACAVAGKSLAARIRRLRPAGIATLVRSIEGIVDRAAGGIAPLHLPYPGRWSAHRKTFTAALVPAIAGLLQRPVATTGSFAGSKR